MPGLISLIHTLRVLAARWQTITIIPSKLIYNLKAPTVLEPYRRLLLTQKCCNHQQIASGASKVHAPITRLLLQTLLFRVRIQAIIQPPAPIILTQDISGRWTEP